MASWPHSRDFRPLRFQQGFSTPTESAPIGVPVGIEFLGPPFSEPQLLQITYGFEQATHAANHRNLRRR